MTDFDARKTLYVLTTGALMLIGGCASSPEWSHARIRDKAASDRQFMIDDGECTRIAVSGAPSPALAPPEPIAANISVQGSTYNTATGQRTYGTYTGQVNTNPSGGFGGGFASGMTSGASLGAIIAARQAEEKIHKSCMYARGWSDKASSDAGTGSISTEYTTGNTNSRLPAHPAFAYSDARDEWTADTREFFRFYPKYANGQLYELLNQRVKALAATNSMTGPQYLVTTINQLANEGKGPAEDPGDSGGIRAIYLRAVQGNPADQAALGLFYADGRDPRLPIDPVRSAHWSRKAAIAGNGMGQLGYAIALFAGIGAKQDKVNAYLWAKLAESKGINVKSTLSMFENEMSPHELQATR